MICAGRGDHVLFYHCAAKIVCAVMQSLSPNIQTLRQPGRLNIRYVVEIQPTNRKPSQVLIARNAIRKSFADRSVVWLKRPRDKRYKTRIPILKLTQPLKVHEAMIASLSHPKHHRRGCRYSKRMRHIHDVKPFLGVAVGPSLAADFVYQNLAAATWDRIQAGLPQLAQNAFNTQPRYFGKMVQLRR